MINKQTYKEIEDNQNIKQLIKIIKKDAANIELSENELINHDKYRIVNENPISKSEFCKTYICQIQQKERFQENVISEDNALVKLMPANAKHYKTMYQKYIDEIAILKGIKSEYIVKFLDSFEDDQYLGILMEYCEGGTLMQYLRNIYKVPLNKTIFISEDETLYYVLQSYLGLDILHKMTKTFFRKLSVNNLLVSLETVKISDFSLAKQIGAQTNATITGVDFSIPPELLKIDNGLIIDGDSISMDVFCIGQIMYQLTQGQQPFETSNPQGYIADIKIKTENDNKIQFPRDISPHLQVLIYQCLRYNPKDRIKWEDIVNHKAIVDYLNKPLENNFHIKFKDIKFQQIKKEIMALQNKNKLQSNDIQATVILGTHQIVNQNVQQQSKQIQDLNQLQNQSIESYDYNPTSIKPKRIRGHKMENHKKILEFISRSNYINFQGELLQNSFIYQEFSLFQNLGIQFVLYLINHKLWAENLLFIRNLLHIIDLNKEISQQNNQPIGEENKANQENKIKEYKLGPNDKELYTVKYYTDLMQIPQNQQNKLAEIKSNEENDFMTDQSKDAFVKYFLFIRRMALIIQILEEYLTFNSIDYISGIENFQRFKISDQQAQILQKLKNNFDLIKKENLGELISKENQLQFGQLQQIFDDKISHLQLDIYSSEQFQEFYNAVLYQYLQMISGQKDSVSQRTTLNLYLLLIHSNIKTQVKDHSYNYNDYITKLEQILKAINDQENFKQLRTMIELQIQKLKVAQKDNEKLSKPQSSEESKNIDQFELLRDYVVEYLYFYELDPKTEKVSKQYSDELNTLKQTQISQESAFLASLQFFKELDQKLMTKKFQ